ncbi:MAG TPA: hypothetical protein DFK12_12415 [Gallionellaceae bacterium]|nr:hypothetical protein [Gallionellaceae bacterium]
MKIENSTVGLTSQHASSRLHTVEESLRAWVGDRRPDFEQRGDARAQGLRPLNPQTGVTVATLSDAGRQAAARHQSGVSADAVSATTETANPAENDPKMLMLIGLIEALTGRKVRLFDPNSIKHDGAAVPVEGNHGEGNHGAAAAENRRQGWGVEYDRRETLHEAEVTRFNAEGVVKTSDGREISFKLSLEMSREFYQETNVSIREGDGVKKDPLVINFAGTAAQLTDTKFAFDLDSDGKTDQMSFVSAGSGFLALDKNANGVIDNGSELFGTQSGNGFADLAAYDSDGNQWIDENDAVYSKLRVWSKDADGKDQLSTLAQRNVGALYLGNVATPFDLKNGANELQGQVRSSGVYLNEDGSAGTLQQVDLVV